jgi:Zn-dependent protease
VPPAGWYGPPASGQFGPPPGTQQPRKGRRRGFWGGILAFLAAIAAYGKYAILLLLKLKFLGTLLTALISFGVYAVFFGPGFAVGLILMLLVHEMGHVIEIRRQGMRATAPLFIPFMGAAIFQRQNATDALHQAEIGIAGPIAGTIGATAAWIAFAVTKNPVFLLWAYLGFFINLINLIPMGMLDGGWILAVASKWFQIVGLVMLAALTYFIGVSPILIIILLFSIPSIIARFRNDGLAYYQSVPLGARLAMGVAWLALVGYLGFATIGAHQVLAGIAGITGGSSFNW